jgi:hypothetical protein
MKNTKEQEASQILDVNSETLRCWDRNGIK